MSMMLAYAASNQNMVVAFMCTTVFLKSAFFVFLVIFLQTWAEIDGRHLPIFFLLPGGLGGQVNRGQLRGQTLEFPSEK